MPRPSLEAFASIDTAAIVAIGRLDAVSDQLDTTIAACASADEWETAAEGALAGLDIGDPQASIGARWSTDFACRRGHLHRGWLLGNTSLGEGGRATDSLTGDDAW